METSMGMEGMEGTEGIIMQCSSSLRRKKRERRPVVAISGAKLPPLVVDAEMEFNMCIMQE